MLYEQIVGQKEAKDRLIKMVTENRVPHALLFSGKEGCGHLPTAFAFAQHLFCKAPLESGPCNTCASCLKVNKLVHPDLHLVFPIAKIRDVTISDVFVKEFREAFLGNRYLTLNEWFSQIKSENKLPIITVDEAADILRKLSFTSFEGGYKVMVIWQPEKMNIEAANKLLKVLEEPTDKTIFVLVTSNQDQLLPTIISRVQMIPFYPVSDDEITNALVDQFRVNRNLAAQAAILANGNFAEAVTVLTDSNESVSFLQHFQTFMRLALRFDCTKALQWIDDNAATGREAQKQFLQYGLEIFRDCLMYNFGNKDLVRLSGAEREFLEKFAPYITLKNYERLVEEFNSDYYYVERYANPKILFMDLLLKTNELINLK